MEEGLSSIKISHEAGKQPEKDKRNGNGNYCCVPNCKSTQYKANNKTKIKTGIGFLIFINPKNEERNGFKVCLDFIEEEGKINSVQIIHSF